MEQPRGRVLDHAGLRRPGNGGIDRTVAWPPVVAARLRRALYVSSPVAGAGFRFRSADIHQPGRIPAKPGIPGAGAHDRLCSQLDPGFLEASRSLGAGEFTTFRRVTLPLVAKGIAAGAFLAFMASFDNVPVSLFLADERTEMLPIHMWQQIESNLDVRTAAVSGVIVIVTLILMITAERMAGLTRQMR